MRELLQVSRLLPNRLGGYGLRFARGVEDVRAAQRLRFEVFNLELGEGLASSFETGLDADEFDEVCDHLIVDRLGDGRVVGTYRMQPGRRALERLGYYSSREFDLSPFEPWRCEMIEIGRACVDKAHRNLNVLGLLWKGIADYAREQGGHLLFGCSSLTSRDPRVGAAAYSQFVRGHLAEPRFQVRPKEAFACSMASLAEGPVKIPKLLNAYLSVGARICGPPAMDHEFGTIDFLTLLDLGGLSAQLRDRFLK